MIPQEMGNIINPQLLVHVLRNLRIVDASVVPTIPGSHTSSTVFAGAEKVRF